MTGDLEKLRGEIAGLVAGLSVDETQLRPNGQAGKWSVQEIIEHLLKSYVSSTGAIGARVGKGTPTKGSPTLMQRAGQLTLIRMGIFPGGRLAPAAVTPENHGQRYSGAELAEMSRVELERMEAAIAAAEGLFGKGRSVSHFILGPLSMPQWRRFHLIHGRHHLKQIAGILKARV